LSELRGAMDSLNTQHVSLPINNLVSIPQTLQGYNRHMFWHRSSDRKKLASTLNADLANAQSATEKLNQLNAAEIDLFREDLTRDKTHLFSRNRCGSRLLDQITYMREQLLASFNKNGTEVKALIEDFKKLFALLCGEVPRNSILAEAFRFIKIENINFDDIGHIERLLYQHKKSFTDTSSYTQRLLYESVQRYCENTLSYIHADRISTNALQRPVI
jgi:hypothetical protein